MDKFTEVIVGQATQHSRRKVLAGIGKVHTINIHDLMIFQPDSQIYHISRQFNSKDTRGYHSFSNESPRTLLDQLNYSGDFLDARHSQRHL